MGIEIILKMLLAAVLGGITGLEREIAHKEAGLKITVLIAVGSALSAGLAVEIAGAGQAAQAFPMLAHIISALGLIGAGIIVRERFAARGIASAAVVWCAGVLGIAVGTGYYLPAFAASIFIVIGLILLRRLSAFIEKQGKVFVYVFSTEDNASVLIEIKKVITELGIKYIDACIKKERDGYRIEIAVHTSHTKNKSFIERIMQIPDVREIGSENL